MAWLLRPHMWKKTVASLPVSWACAEEEKGKTKYPSVYSKNQGCGKNVKFPYFRPEGRPVGRVDPNFLLHDDWNCAHGLGLLNKLRKDCFLKHHGLKGPESAAWARGTICRTFKSIQIIQSAKLEQNRHLNVLLKQVTFHEWRWEFEIASAVIKLSTVVMYLYNRL